MKIQVTLFNENKKYRPIATTIKVESLADFEANFQQYKIKAINKIASARYQTGTDLVNAGFTQLKWRPYAAEDRKQAFVERMCKKK